MILNPIQNGICVVPFDDQPPYNEFIKYKGGGKAMNTDKIYAFENIELAKEISEN